MTLEIFTIYDTKSETYFQPFYMLNTGNGSTPIRRHGE